MTPFADLGISAPLVRALARRGITKSFPTQQLVATDVAWPATSASAASSTAPTASRPL